MPRSRFRWEAVEEAGPRPVLLIAGGSVPDEINAARHIAGDRENVVWVIPNAGHIDGLNTAPAEWESRVVEFLDDALLD